MTGSTNLAACQIQPRLRVHANVVATMYHSSPHHMHPKLGTRQGVSNPIIPETQIVPQGYTENPQSIVGTKLALWAAAFSNKNKVKMHLLLDIKMDLKLNQWRFISKVDAKNPATHFLVHFHLSLVVVWFSDLLRRVTLRTMYFHPVVKIYISFV